MCCGDGICPDCCGTGEALAPTTDLDHHHDTTDIKDCAVSDEAGWKASA